MMQESIVALIVVCAAWTVARRYLPKAVRATLRAWSARAAAAIGWHGMAQKLATAPVPVQGCGSGCDTCGSCDTPDTPPLQQRQISIRKI